MRYSVFAGVKVPVEFEGVRDVVCFEENKISHTKLYPKSSTKREAIKLEARANRTVGNEVNDRKIFEGKRRGRSQKYRLEFVHGGWFIILRAGAYDPVLDFGSVRQVLYILL